MPPTLSVIVPTCGRETLAATLACCVGQLEPGDEVIVVGDGDQPGARRLCEALKGVRYLERAMQGSRFGNAQRDHGMRAATGSHLLFIDDDDCHEPDAFVRIRARLAEYPERAHIFRARWGPGHHAHGVVLWKVPAVVSQNIATPMVVLPNRRYLTSWMAHNAAGIVSDYGFLSHALAELGEPVWHSQVIAIVRPLAAEGA